MLETKVIGKKQVYLMIYQGCSMVSNAERRTDAKLLNQPPSWFLVGILPDAKWDGQSSAQRSLARCVTCER